MALLHSTARSQLKSCLPSPCSILGTLAPKKALLYSPSRVAEGLRVGESPLGQALSSCDPQMQEGRPS